MLLVQLAACILLVPSKRLSRKLNSKLCWQNQRQAFRFHGQLYQRQRHSQPVGFCHSHIPLLARHIPSFTFLLLQLLVATGMKAGMLARPPSKLPGLRGVAVCRWLSTSGLKPRMHLD